MTLNQLYYFKKVAEMQNYHRAAEELFISQPSLSRAIATLETELGVPLFEKRGRGIVLTKVGKVFLDYAERITAECEVAVDKMRELGTDGGKIDIGYVFPLATHFIPHHCREFLNKGENGKVIFNFYQSYTTDIIKKCKSGELDIGFGGYVDDETEFEFFPVVDQEVVIITPKEHPLNEKCELSISELTKYPVVGYNRESWMGINTSKLYDRLDLNVNKVIECPDEYSIMAMVSENYGLALVPKVDSLDESRVCIHSLSDIDLSHITYMFWPKNRYLMPSARRFIDYMKHIAVEPVHKNYD